MESEKWKRIPNENLTMRKEESDNSYRAESFNWQL